MKRPESGTAKPITDLEKEPHKTFIFPEAIFTAVTAYQNQLVSLALFLATATFLSSSILHLLRVLLFSPFILAHPSFPRSLFTFFLTRSSSRVGRDLPLAVTQRVSHVPPGLVLPRSARPPSHRIIVSSLHRLKRTNCAPPFPFLPAVSPNSAATANLRLPLRDV